MRVILILPMLLLTLSAAASSKWEFVAENKNDTVYFIDRSTYQKSDDSITFWQLINFKSRQINNVLSFKAQYIINCRLREMKLKFINAYDDIDGNGQVKYSGKIDSSWDPVAPGTGDWLIMDYVCK